MIKYILEVCVDSVESAISAVKGGADRLELCANLPIGGTTPSLLLFQKIRKISPIPMHILIRPRFGDFLYTDYEFEMMKETVSEYRKAGAEGIVIGILKADGNLDVKRMKALIGVAGGMWVTLHRAFDVCADPLKTLQEARAIGVNTVLTSGQKNLCTEGAELIRELVRQSKGEIEVLVGGGVAAGVITELAPQTGATAFHMSGKEVVASAMEYRNQDVKMGVADMDEFEHWRTNEINVRQAKLALMQVESKRDIQAGN